MRLAPEYAGFGRRLLAMFIDSMLFSLLSAVVSQLLFGQPALQINVTPAGLEFEQTNQLDDMLISFAVTVVMWVRLGGTPGKLLLDCHVVDAVSGDRISWKQAALRYIGYFVSLIPLGLGFLWIIWDKKKQGFHDKIARTVVVQNLDRHENANDESQKTLEQLVNELK